MRIYKKIIVIKDMIKTKYIINYNIIQKTKIITNNY